MKRWQVQINRKNAIEIGSKFYIGAPCSKFLSHGNKRYVVSANCVECDKAKSKAINAGLIKTGVARRKPIKVRPPYTQEQIERLESGRAEKFFGRACQKGHDGLRYVNGGGCVACSEAARPPKGLTKSERLNWVRDRRRERKAKQNAVMQAILERANRIAEYYDLF